MGIDRREDVLPLLEALMIDLRGKGEIADAEAVLAGSPPRLKGP